MQHDLLPKHEFLGVFFLCVFAYTTQVFSLTGFAVLKNKSLGHHAMSGIK
jgi:hypothetical protein